MRKFSLRSVTVLFFNSFCMARILILFAHPAFEHSRIHTQLLKAVKPLQHVTVRDLYEEYPDFDVLPRVEQKILEQHDVIIFQHPFYWYSCPALLKQWMDLTLEHGWAYGKNGTALQGKYLLNVVSTGGHEGSYSPEGHHGHNFHNYMLPFSQTARLCHMEYLPPYVVHGANQLTPADLQIFAGGYVQLLNNLQSGAFSLPAARQLPYLNSLVGAPVL